MALYAWRNALNVFQGPKRVTLMYTGYYSNKKYKLSFCGQVSKPLSEMTSFMSSRISHVAACELNCEFPMESDLILRVRNNSIIVLKNSYVELSYVLIVN